MNAPRHDGADVFPRPHLRRPPLDEVATFRLRVDLDEAQPPVWRELELRSDLTLDVVHRALQAAYGWEDRHLHRFALGGDPLGLDAELFLCAYDVEEGDDEGVPEGDARLDEALQVAGDELFYVYDYGDQWALTLVLQEVAPRLPGEPLGTCTGGAGAAPLEDSGGVPGQRQGSDFDVVAVSEAVQRATGRRVPRARRG